MGKKRKIRVAVTGVGNCASALIQGIEYYRHNRSADLGLMHRNLGGYFPEDVEIVAAFDVDRRKVGRPLQEAVLASPNCVIPIWPALPDYGIRVQMGPILDGVAPHMKEFPPERTFVVADEKPVAVEEVLKKTRADIMVNYLPVGSGAATRYYAGCCLLTGVSFVNCMPEFIASDPAWAKQFKKKGIPIIGDDIKSQVGATIIHRVLAHLFEERGAKIKRTYQLNTGGNTDFLNMLERKRLINKKISKTEAVQSQLSTPLADENIHIGPSDYVPWQGDNKVCFLRIEAVNFCGVPLELEARLSVQDSPNSAGVAIDAIRYCQVARDRGEAGALLPASAYLMKHPPRQMDEGDARRRMETYLAAPPKNMKTGR
ncbi:MAG: inositol-3-phosphate synthase [Deltaproteobacteria bacterium]|nr:inositol-3-phosphate synthase [Deltaproteobacteria bacterium]